MTGSAGGERPPLVLDAMCLNHFARVDRLDVLGGLLVGDECCTTSVVMDELRRGTLMHPILRATLELEWVRVLPLDSLFEVACFVKWVGRIGAGDRNLGEASVFAAAELLDGMAITDDQPATRVARRHGLDVHGTIWLLARSCRAGKLAVPAASNMVDMLRGSGMWLPVTGPEFEPWARERGLLSP